MKPEDVHYMMPMFAVAKFNIGDKFRFNKEHRNVSCTTEKDIFRIEK